MYYSKSTNGFYSDEIHGANLPNDCVEISQEVYLELINKQSSGLVIVSNDSGLPVAVEPSYSDEQLAQAAETNRKAAYQAEADPLFFKWQAGEGTQEEWVAKRAEIRERFPYPEE